MLNLFDYSHYKKDIGGPISSVEVGDFIFPFAPDDNIGCVKLVDKMEQAVPLKVVNSARISYKDHHDELTEGDSKLTAFLWTNEHTSPFRHSYYSFHIKAPLYVFRQWIKYQVGSTWRTYTVDGQEVSFEVWDELFDADKGCSWNEASARYKELKPEFYTPAKWRGQDAKNKQGSSPIDGASSSWHAENTAIAVAKCEQDYAYYSRLLKEGVCREQARAYLPQCIYTESIWTVSLQSVLWFLHQRLKPEAQWEIKQYAEAIRALIQPDLEKMELKI